MCVIMLHELFVINKGSIVLWGRRQNMMVLHNWGDAIIQRVSEKVELPPGGAAEVISWRSRKEPSQLQLIVLFFLEAVTSQGCSLVYISLVVLLMCYHLFLSWLHLIFENRCGSWKCYLCMWLTVNLLWVICQSIWGILKVLIIISLNWMRWLNNLFSWSFFLVISCLAWCVNIYELCLELSVLSTAKLLLIYMNSFWCTLFHP